MFLNTEIAQILPGGLFRPLQSEKKHLRVRKKVIPYFQAPKIKSTPLAHFFVEDGAPGLNPGRLIRKGTPGARFAVPSGQACHFHR